MLDDFAIRKLTMAVLLLFIGGGLSIYMLTHLDYESKRLLDVKLKWYGEGKIKDQGIELFRIRKNIRVFYFILLIISILAAALFSWKLLSLLVRT